MALIKDVTISGVVVKDCYIEVGSITLSTDRTEIYFNVNFSATKENPPLFTDYFSCKYLAGVGDIDEQAYDFLKTLEKFSKSEHI